MADEKENKFDQDTQNPPSDVIDSHIQHDQTIEEAPEDMAVSRISRSLSLSPLSRALDTTFDSSSFVLCPELNLGDLAMPFNPISSLDLQEEHVPANLETIPDIPVHPESPAKLQFGYLDCEAFINFQDSAVIPDLPTQHEVFACQNPSAPSSSDVDFAASLDLISRATAALAPFSRFAPDAQLLLADLQTLNLQLKLLRKPLPYLPNPTTYHNTMRDVVLCIRDPLEVFLARLDKISIADNQGPGQTATKRMFRSVSFAWAWRVKDDARRLREMIASRSTTISILMTLFSM